MDPNRNSKADDSQDDQPQNLNVPVPHAADSRSDQTPNDALLYGRVVADEAGQPHRSKKKWILFGIVVLVLVLAGAGFVFGYYLPNKPENVWRTSLTRTGEGLESITTATTEKNKLDSFKRSHIAASAEYKNTNSSYLMTFKNTFEDRKADGSLDVVTKTKDQPDRTFGVKFLGELKEGHTYPSIYLQLSGLKTLGIEQWEMTYPGISEYDGKWIAIEEDYLRSLAEQFSGMGQSAEQQQTDTKKENTVTSDDIAALARTVSGTLAEYVLTGDSTKAVIEQRSFIGKETVEGVNTYHYKAGINKPYAKEFCKVMTKRFAETQLYKKLNSEMNLDTKKREENNKASVENCQRSVDDMKQDTFDLWVDAKYKLIHKIRVTDKENKDIYTELGQKYQGGDDLSLFVKTHNGKEQSDGRLTLDTNLKTMETKGKLSFKSTKQENPYEITASLEAKPAKEDIKIEKPAGAVPVKDIMDRYGIDPAGLLLLQGMTGQEATQAEGIDAPQYLN